MLLKQLFRSGLLLVAVAAALSIATAQQLVQNSFGANVSGATQYDLSNSVFTAKVPFWTGFGAANETDVIYGSDFGPAPPYGTSKLGLRTRANGDNDRVSTTLLAPVGAGTQLRLRFWTTHLKPTTIIVGLSNSPTSMGTEIYRVATTASWMQTFVAVVAPQAGQYLTFMTDQSPLDGYAFVTGVSLMPLTLVGPIGAGASPQEIRTGERSTITVVLNRRAPTGGTLVFIRYSNGAVAGPRFVIVPSGRRTATFNVLGNNRSTAPERVDLFLTTTGGWTGTSVLVNPRN
ncbi:MAG TPA: hypothetical protein PLH94_12410 [Fimbriimonadaceae bacterium]|nr:hypothetical protein [Fimbriimonadaceae bacterium]